MPEPVLIMVRRYECPFCRRRRSAKAAAREHIGRCWLNPATRSCKTCANYDFQPPGDWCEGSRPCPCNQGHEQCTAGVDLDGTLRTGCPLWRLREEAADA